MPASKKTKLKHTDFKKKRVKVGQKAAKPDSYTDTTVRTRKILLLDQSSLDQKAGPVSKRGQTLQTLLAQCRHSSAHTRQAALLGIRQILLNFPAESVQTFVDCETPRMLPRVLERSSDGDKAVRKEFLQLFQLLVATASPATREHFAPLVMSHLATGLGRTGRSGGDQVFDAVTFWVERFPLPPHARTTLLRAVFRHLSVGRERLASCGLADTNRMIGIVCQLLRAAPHRTARVSGTEHVAGPLFPDPRPLHFHAPPPPPLVRFLGGAPAAAAEFDSSSFLLLLGAALLEMGPEMLLPLPNARSQLVLNALHAAAMIVDDLRTRGDDAAATARVALFRGTFEKTLAFFPYRPSGRGCEMLLLLVNARFCKLCALLDFNARAAPDEATRDAIAAPRRFSGLGGVAPKRPPPGAAAAATRGEQAPVHPVWEEWLLTELQAQPPPAAVPVLLETAKHFLPSRRVASALCTLVRQLSPGSAEQSLALLVLARLYLPLPPPPPPSLATAAAAFAEVRHAPDLGVKGEFTQSCAIAACQASRANPAAALFALEALRRMHVRGARSSRIGELVPNIVGVALPNGRFVSPLLTLLGASEEAFGHAVWILRACRDPTHIARLTGRLPPATRDRVLAALAVQ